MRKKLAIFDLDGTLFDTSIANRIAYQKALNLCGYHITLDHEHFKKYCNGRSFRDFLPPFLPLSFLSLNENEKEEILQRIHHEKISVYPDFLETIIPNKYLFDLIHAVKDTYHIALVTTASKTCTNQILEHFQVKDLFELIITQEDVERRKPDPEGFLLAMEYFCVTKENTLIFEDSDVGINAAKSAGTGYVKVGGYS